MEAAGMDRWDGGHAGPGLVDGALQHTVGPEILVKRALQFRNPATYDSRAFRALRFPRRNSSMQARVKLALALSTALLAACSSSGNSSIGGHTRVRSYGHNKSLMMLYLISQTIFYLLLTKP